MNEKTANLAISEMRLRLFERIELLYEQENFSDGNALAEEWLLDDRKYNPDHDNDYVFLVDSYHKKTRTQRYKKFEDLEF